MPLSFLTRLRGAIIVAAFAFALLCLEISAQPWVLGFALFLLPLLIWLLVSNAVKDAPPFDDHAFHRTRPVAAGHVFRHLAGFHLLVLAALLLVVVAYVWRFNLGGRGAVVGGLIVAIPWIALVSLFGAAASLSTSPNHWKGWPLVTLLLIPAISLFCFCALVLPRFNRISVEGLPVAGALVYPALWWLIAVKRRWLLGNVLGLVIGILMPWMSLPVRFPAGSGWHEAPEQNPGIAIQRLKDPSDATGMHDNQAAVSRLLEVRGLGPDEFIQVAGMGVVVPGMNRFANGFSPDPVMNDMSFTYFCADRDGRLIPATASLFHATGDNRASLAWWDNRRYETRELTLEDRMRLPIRLYSTAGRELLRPSADAAGKAWTIHGSSFRWARVLDVPASKGGRAKLPGGGVVRMFPLEENSGDFALVLRVIRPERSWKPGGSPAPLVVARSPDGVARLIDLEVSGVSRTGFLTNETEYQFREETTGRARGTERLKVLRDARLEVYWAEFRGTFAAELPPPR